MIVNENEQESQAPQEGQESQEPQAPQEPAPTPEQRELAAMRAEIAALRAQQSTPQQTQQTITSETLESYSPEQWAVIEEKTGKTKDQVIRDYKDYEITKRQNAIDAKANMSDAMSEAIEANPKLIKLRGSIKEYMDDIPASDKLDPAKIKRHMEKAITYAKGKHMTSTPDSTPGRRPGSSTPSPKGGADDYGDDSDVVDGEMKDDEYVSETGLRIKTGKVSKETWKQIRHKTKNPNSVCIPADFDKPPQFNK